MKISGKYMNVETTIEVTIDTVPSEVDSRPLGPWTDEEIASLGIDPFARDYGGCMADEVAMRLLAAGWSMTWVASHAGFAGVSERHVFEAAPGEIPPALAARVGGALHRVTAAESKRLGPPWCTPSGLSLGGWYYRDAGGELRHAGRAEIGEEGARAAAEAGMSTKSFTL